MFSRSRVRLKEYFENEDNYLLDTKIDSDYRNVTLTVCGWIESMRTQGQDFAFIKLNDGSCVRSLQVIVDTSRVQDCSLLDNIFKRGTTGTSLQIEGMVVASPKPEQKTELVANKIIVLGDVDGSKYPISKGRLPLGTLA